MNKRTGLPDFIFVVLLGLASSVPAFSSPIDMRDILAAFGRRDPERASRLAGDALKQQNITPLERSRFLLARGLAEQMLGAAGDAIKDFTAALGGNLLDPEERSQALLQRGLLLDASGQLDDAAKDYSGVVDLHGKAFSTALNNRANIYRREYRFAEAKRDYEAVLKAGANEQYALFGLGLIAEVEGNYDEARGFYTKSLAADPGYGLASDRLRALSGTSSTILSQNPSVHPSGTAAVSAPKTSGVRAAALQPAPPPHLGDNARQVPVSQKTEGLRPALDQSTSTGPEVQLGAWRTEVAAKTGWEQAQLQSGNILAGRQPHFVTAEVEGRGRYFRLRVSTKTDESPRQLCERLIAKAVSCFPAHD